VLFARLLLLLACILSGCYIIPTDHSGYGHYNENPIIEGYEISCYWNSGYQDYMWSFQAWVNHPAGQREISDVAVDIYHESFMIDTFYLFYEHDGYWSIHIPERSTNLWCGDWYDIKLVAYSWDGKHDSVIIPMAY